MTNYKSRSELKDMAKETLAGNYSACALILLFYYLIVLLADRYLGTSALFSGLVGFLSSMLFVGVNCFFLKLACNQPVASTDLFFVFRENTLKAFVLACIEALVSFLITAPITLLLYDYFQMITIPEETRQLLWFLQLLLLLAWIPLHLTFSQIYYIFLDFPNYNIREILLCSMQKMKGRKIQLLLLEVSFLPLFLLALPTFGIALFWILPYFYATKSHFYLDLMHS